MNNTASSNERSEDCLDLLAALEAKSPQKDDDDVRSDCKAEVEEDFEGRRIFMLGLPADGSLLEGMNRWKTKEGRKESLEL